MKIQCLHCKSGFNVSEEHIGKKVVCPKCNEPFIIAKTGPSKIFPLRVIHTGQHELAVAELVNLLKQVLDTLTNPDEDAVAGARTLLRKAIDKYEGKSLK
jgi:predicted Zn finger-like uncharacterized protein